MNQNFANPEELEQALGATAWLWLETYEHTLSMPLGQLLDRYKTAIEVGISLGIQADTTSTVEWAKKHINEGYRRIKLKIKPSWNTQILEATCQMFPNIRLTIDANSAYTLASTAKLQSLDAFNLPYMKQPLAWNNLYEEHWDE